MHVSRRVSEQRHARARTGRGAGRRTNRGDLHRVCSQDKSVDPRMTETAPVAILTGETVGGLPQTGGHPPLPPTPARSRRRIVLVDLSPAPVPADPRSLELRRAGAKAVLVGTPAPPALPFGVVESKIHVPAPPVGTVSRTALVNRLRAAGAFPLVLVVAPAGYGKTTLLSQWANRDVRPFAWVSIDECDNDPVAFLRHVAAALDRVEPIPASALEPLRLDGK